MKKISTIDELRLEKAKLKLYRNELEKELSNNWSGLKESLSPIQIAGSMFKNAMNYKTIKKFTSDGLFKSALIFGYTMLAERLIHKASDKFNSILKKIN